MSLTLFVLWAVGGWCGTPWPGWWRGPRPHPDPEPCLVVQVIGVVAGLVGGWIITQVAGPRPEPWRLTTDIITATTIGAVLASRLVTDIYRLARGGASAGQG